MRGMLAKMAISQLLIGLSKNVLSMTYSLGGPLTANNQIKVQHIQKEWVRNNAF